MFNNRDLGILGGGALLAVLCLFLPLSFVGKVVIGFLVLVFLFITQIFCFECDRLLICDRYIAQKICNT